MLDPKHKNNLPNSERPVTGIPSGRGRGYLYQFKEYTGVYPTLDNSGLTW
jgi:hypothetical protein